MWIPSTDVEIVETEERKGEREREDRPRRVRASLETRLWTGLHTCNTLTPLLNTGIHFYIKSLCNNICPVGQNLHYNINDIHFNKLHKRICYA